MSKQIYLLIASLLMTLQPLTAHAWGDLGHSIVGQVAEDVMAPETKNFVRGILGIEPLSVAAIFPDHVRDDQRFHPDFDNFHFCEIPTGYTYDNRPKKAAKDCYGAITKSLEILKDPKGKISREEKMLALRYLTHLLGDIHMPLHIGNGYDLGGNACSVRWMTEVKPTNLHTVWDTNLVVDQLAIGQIVTIEVKSAELGDPIVCKAVVQYVTQSAYVGFKFSQLSMENKARILQYVKQVNQGVTAVGNFGQAA